VSQKSVINLAWQSVDTEGETNKDGGTQSSQDRHSKYPVSLLLALTQTCPLQIASVMLQYIVATAQLHNRCATPHKALCICGHPSWLSVGSVQSLSHIINFWGFFHGTNSIFQTEEMARDKYFPVAKLTPINCGCFGNTCTCIYCVLYCLYCVFVLYRLSILICFACTCVRTTATEWKLNCS
jgi:hypothetical protein